NVLATDTVERRQRSVGGESCLGHPAAEDMAGSPGHVAVDPQHFAVMHTAPGVPVLNARVPPCTIHQAQRGQVDNGPEPRRIDAASLTEHLADKVLFLVRAQLAGTHGRASRSPLSIARENSLPQKRQVAMPGRISAQVEVLAADAADGYAPVNRAAEATAETGLRRTPRPHA